MNPFQASWTPWAFIMAAILIFALVVHGQEGSPRISGTDKFQPKIPPPPQLSADDIYQQLWRAHAQIELANKYIAQLQQELTAAQALCTKPEETDKEK